MEERKSDHIKLAFKSQTSINELDKRFYYEPVLAAHPNKPLPEISFAKKTIVSPLWASSMTGGTALANRINHNIARACNEFKMGMGLGSCRGLLDSDTYLKDFDLRPIIGNDLPFYANLGIAQIEQLIIENKLFKITNLLEKLQADGLIIHINPLQEWIQPEGDKYYIPPIDAIEAVLSQLNIRIIVKEVGQGMGFESLKRLLNLPLDAIELAGFGGTNFSLLEIFRNHPNQQDTYMPFALVGHDLEQMIEFTNLLANENNRKCHQLIISGGIKNYLDGYYFIQKSKIPAIYAQASGILKYAKESYDDLRDYIQSQIDGYRLASNLLKIR